MTLQVWSRSRTWEWHRTKERWQQSHGRHHDSWSCASVLGFPIWDKLGRAVGSAIPSAWENSSTCPWWNDILRAFNSAQVLRASSYPSHRARRAPHSRWRSCLPLCSTSPLPPLQPGPSLLRLSFSLVFISGWHGPPSQPSQYPLSSSYLAWALYIHGHSLHLVWLRPLSLKYVDQFFCEMCPRWSQLLGNMHFTLCPRILALLWEAMGIRWANKVCLGRLGRLESPCIWLQLVGIYIHSERWPISVRTFTTITSPHTQTAAPTATEWIIMGKCLSLPQFLLRLRKSFRSIEFRYSESSRPKSRLLYPTPSIAASSHKMDYLELPYGLCWAV